MSIRNELAVLGAAAALFIGEPPAFKARTEYKYSAALTQKVWELAKNGYLQKAAASNEPVTELGGRIDFGINSSSPTVIFKEKDGRLTVEMLGISEFGWGMVSRQITTDKDGHVKSKTKKPHRERQPCFRGMHCGGTPG